MATLYQGKNDSEAREEFVPIILIRTTPITMFGIELVLETYPCFHRPYAILLYLTYLCRQSLMSSIQTTLFKPFSKMEDINRRTDVYPGKKHLPKYVKKTDDINRLNRARSHTDGGFCE